MQQCFWLPGWLLCVLRPFETVFQSISDRLIDRGGRRNDRREKKVLSDLGLSYLLMLSLQLLRIFKESPTLIHINPSSVSIMQLCSLIQVFDVCISYTCIINLIMHFFSNMIKNDIFHQYYPFTISIYKQDCLKNVLTLLPTTNKHVVQLDRDY